MKMASWSGCTAVLSQWLWLFLYVTCEQTLPEEEELFSSVKQKLEWKSYPDKAWNEVRMKLGSVTPNPVYQACSSKNGKKTLWSNWIQRKDSQLLFMDLTFTQEMEAQLSPLLIFLMESDAPLKRFTFEDEAPVLSLRAPDPFHPEAKVPEEIEHNLNFSQSLHLGEGFKKGLYLGFSYSGPCLFIASFRLYFKYCPSLVESRASFVKVAGGSGIVNGVCVENSVEVKEPQRECHTDGLWGRLQGQCDCKPGYQEIGESCVVCRAGTYKPMYGNGECIPCPGNSKADGEGAVQCECMLGYHRLPDDPSKVGCTRPPSAPQHVRVHSLHDSLLELHWDPPLDQNGWEEVWYTLQCLERKEDSGSKWEVCGDDVHFYPNHHRLNDTAVNITGIDPYSDYQLSVAAANTISTEQNITAAAGSVTIMRTKRIQIANPTAAPIREEGHSPWILWIGVGSGLLLVTLVIAVVCHKRRNYIKLGQDQELALLPMQTAITYRRPEQQELAPAPQPVNIQLLEGLNGRLQVTLKEMLVDRSALTLGKALGAGEFGTVHEGIFSPQEGNNIRVAVKTMKVGVHSQEDLESFLKEAEIMKNFDHDNVVKLLGVALEEAQGQKSSIPVPMVLMPFMKHGDLRRFLIATRYGDVPMFVPYQSLLRFMIDIAAGMEYLSYQSFIHRDLAARNCMLDDDLRVRVADFGLSKKIYSSNYYRQAGTGRMPVKWMAIESLSESIYSTKSDVWSFGVTMWEIMSRGRTPYPGVHNHEILDLLESGCRLKQLECDCKLYEVMLSCWNSDPKQRPDFGELGAKLKTLLSELPPLEASQEAHYINQGLEVADQRTAEGVDPETEVGATGNLYLPNPTALKPPMDEDEDGYLQFIKSKPEKK